jgi:hypothetical protein
MAHFAELDENNVVLRVVVTDNDAPNEGLDWLLETFGGTWIQTSYNRTIRKHFAGIGYSYDEVLDAFIPPQPYPSWILNKQTCQWEAPIPYPTNGFSYRWNVVNGDWELIDYAESTEAIES